MKLYGVKQISILARSPDINDMEIFGYLISSKLQSDAIDEILHTNHLNSFLSE